MLLLHTAGIEQDINNVNSESVTCQSCGMYKDGATEERDVVAGVEAVPEC